MSTGEPPVKIESSKKDSAVVRVEKIEQSFLSCPICYDVYTEPKCLPCLHTLCRDCLSSYIETQGDYGAKRKMGFPCPICKQFVFVKSSSKPLNEWADDIQNNFLIQNMIDSLLPKSESASSDTDTHSSQSESSLSDTIRPFSSDLDLSPSTSSSLTASNLHRNNSKPVPSATLLSEDRVPSRSSNDSLDWSVISNEYLSRFTSGAVSNLSGIIRPSSSTLDISPSTSSSLTASNLFRNNSRPVPSASSDTATHSSQVPCRPSAFAPQPEPELNRPVPPASPLSEDRVPNRSSNYSLDWSVLSSEYLSRFTSGAVSNLSGIIRPSSSTLDISPSTSSSVTASNLYRNRTNSSSDLNRAEIAVLFVEPFVPWVYDYGLGAYHRKPQFSDVCCLPTSSSIVATDYNNCRVVLFERIFPRYGGDSTKHVKVNGRPCSIALLDKEKEDCVAVNLQNKKKLVFISVPSMRIIREMRTDRNFRSVAVISPTILIAGSPDRPASIEQIDIDSNYKLKSRHVLVQNGEKWDISTPAHLCMLSSSTFLVSDSDKKSIICFEITEDSRGRTIAKKRYSIAPRGDRKFRSPGGLVVDNSTGCVYTVDYGSNLVLKITPGDTIACETLLTSSDNVYKPASVCLGPGHQLCVVDWEGNITIYKQAVS